MASLTCITTLSLDANTSAPPSHCVTSINCSNDSGQQQQCETIGRSCDSDAHAMATPKHAVALSPRRPEDNNQHEDDISSSHKETAAVAPTSRPEQQSAEVAPTSTSPVGTRQQQPQLPVETPHQSPELLELSRLRRDNQTLTNRLHDASALCARHALALETAQQQHVAATTNWQHQVDTLQRAHVEAVDDARRAQAQVQVLEGRLAQSSPLLMQSIVEPSSSSDTARDQQQVTVAVPTLQPLRLTRQQSSEPHAVHRSVVSAHALHVTSHALSMRSEVQTVRATRLGRQRPAAVAAASEASSSLPLGVTRMPPPPASAIHWRGYAPPSAPVASRSQSYAQQQQQLPIGYQHYQPHQQPFAVAPVSAPAPDSLPVFSIDLESDGATCTTSCERAQSDPLRPASGLLAYCSDLLTSSRLAASAPAPTPTPALPSTHVTRTNASATARVTPVWTFFSGSSPAKPTMNSPDVEQGFGSLDTVGYEPEQSHSTPYADTSFANPVATAALHTVSSSMTQIPVRRVGTASVQPAHDAFNESV